MKTNVTNRKRNPGSLQPPRTARTVLLRMAADEARAERIRELKDQRPDLTWRRIGDAVGVSERSAVAWQKTGGIDYEHAKRLAEVFEVDLDWLWRGPVEDDTPDLLDVVAREETLDQVIDRFSGRVDDVEHRLERIEQAVTTSHNHDNRIEELLGRQGQVLEAMQDMLNRQSQILERIEVLVATLPSDDTTRRLLDEIRRGHGAA